MFILKILDILISNLFVAPLVVFFWWSVWSFEVYSNSFPASWSLYISTVIVFVFTLLREPLYEKRKSGVLGLLIARIYIYVCAVGIISQWCALFTIFDQLLSMPMIIAILVFSILLLSYLRSLTTLLGPPYLIGLDHKQKEVFIYPTLYQTGSTENWLYYLADCLFTVCAVGLLVVLVWYGFWTLPERLLYPENPELSGWTSIGGGYIISGISFILQPLMKYLVKKLSGLPRMFIVDTYLVFAVCGMVNIWRGIWKILDLRFFPEWHEYRYALCHCIPFLILMLMNAAKTILVRGAYTDDESSGAEGIKFCSDYFGVVYKSMKKGKILRDAESRAYKKDEQTLSEGEGLIQVGVKPILIRKSTNNISASEPNQS